MRILMAASEGVPFSKTGGLADVVGSLPQAIARLDHEVAVVLPRYRMTKLRAPRTALGSLTIPLGRKLHFPAILEGSLQENVHTFFVEYPPFFDRDALYGTPEGEYPDNAERFALFSRAVLEVAKLLFPADVLHCHDWQTGLVPVLLKTAYAEDPLLKNTATLFTIHNLGYQGLFPAAKLEQLGLGPELFTMDGLEFFGKVNILKGALLYSEQLNTVSRKYAEEIQTPDYGFGLDGVIRERAGSLEGILNGADYSQWDPATDPYIEANYSADNLRGKRVCKMDLLEQFHLPADHPKRPVVGMVTRLTAQKGADLIADVADALVQEDFSLVVLGAGDEKYETLFRKLAEQHPQKIAIRIAYDDKLAHKIEAGADVFLMPSRYEPCGLNQIYSLKYGTVPIVHATGGLDDTIEPYDPKAGTGTGFKFQECTGQALLDTVRQALEAFRNRTAWQQLMRNGMAKDFSWDASAKQYVALYQKIVPVEQQAVAG